MLSYVTFSVQVKVFWVFTPCSVVVGYQRFGGPSFLHLHGEVTRVRVTLRLMASQSVPLTCKSWQW